MDISAVYSQNIKAYMDNNDISTNSIATKSGMSQKTIWVVANGKVATTLNTADNLCKALSLDFRAMLLPDMTAKQVGRSSRIARMLDELTLLDNDELAHVSAIIKAFKTRSNID